MVRRRVRTRLLTMLAHVGAEESSKSAMYVLAPLFRPLITCRTRGLT